MLPGKVELQLSVWTSGTQELFVMHVQQAISAIRQKGLKDAYDRLLGNKKEHKTKLQDANLQVDFASEGQEKAFLEQAAMTDATPWLKNRCSRYSLLSLQRNLGSPGLRSCKSR